MMLLRPAHQGVYRSFLPSLGVALLVILLSACETTAPRPDDATGAWITLPMIQGWYQGEPVWYLTTDVSDADLAAKMGANYTPRLRDALLPRPKPPALKSVLERIYVFPGGEQGSVLPSSPKPLGPESGDVHYSPLWQLYEIHWQAGQTPETLKSEEAVLDAEEQGRLRIERTDLVVNCPVVRAVYDGQNQSLGTGSAHSHDQASGW